MNRNFFIKYALTFVLAIGCLLLATAYLLPANFSVALAQELDYDRINNIAKQLNCPTCAGINLADCRTQTCAQWRDQIADLVREGKSDQEILDYFATQHGPQVLQEPPKSGSTLFLWVLPVIALIVGGGWLFYTIRSWSGQEAAPVVDTPSPAAITTKSAEASGDYISQVEKDLGIEEI